MEDAHAWQIAATELIVRRPAASPAKLLAFSALTGLYSAQFGQFFCTQSVFLASKYTVRDEIPRPEANIALRICCHVENLKLIDRFDN